MMDFYAINDVGYSGDLAHLISGFSNNHIDVLVKLEGRDDTWRFIGFYHFMGFWRVVSREIVVVVKTLIHGEFFIVGSHRKL